MFNRQFAVNTYATLLNLIIQFSISFFLTSYLVETVGATAYGFFTLANTVVNYTIIISSALNSMSARFVGIEYHNNNIDSAIKYYSSILFADLLLVGVLLLPACVGIWYINKFINVPDDLLSDVRILFYVVFANMCINVGSAIFSIVFVIKNRLDLSSVITIISNLIKASLLIILYISLKPTIIYLGVATLVATVFIFVSNAYYTKRFLPEIKPTLKSIRWKAIKTVLYAGIWNSLTYLGAALLHSFDLLICNIMISAQAMGCLSVAGVLPGVVGVCIGALSNLFTPKYIELFAANNYDGLLSEIRNSIRFLTIMSCAPICFLVGFGMSFYQLWVPNTDAQMAYLLSVFIILPYFTGAAINSVNYLYTVANKVKWPSIVLLITGALNLLIVYGLLKFSNLGVYSIVIVSATIGLLRNVLFNAPYAAYCIKQKIHVFYPDILRSFVSIVIACVLALFVDRYFTPSTWLDLILVGGVTTLLITLLVALVTLDRHHVKFFLNKITLKS